MAANLCVEGHMRELVEQGFEVAVVKDATAGPRLPEGDGYLAALVNYRFLASAVWTTAEAVALLEEGTDDSRQEHTARIHGRSTRDHQGSLKDMTSIEDPRQHRFALEQRRR